MRMMRILVSVSFCLALTEVAAAQTVQVSRTNKTIEVSVTESVRVDADVAEVQIGYRNFAPAKDAAFEDNVRASNLILKALLDAGVSREAIETATVKLERVSEYDVPGPERKTAQFRATQTWTVRVGAGAAQRIVDAVVAAGANEIDEVEWAFADLPALQARANALALAKARQLAEQMARELGVKLGELLYSSNKMSSQRTPFSSLLLGSDSSIGAAPVKSVPLQLFPAKVTGQASVTLVFAIE
jgi:hypothetical protein